MLWFQIFRDGPEYEARKKNTTFIPPCITLKQVHDAVPKQLFISDTRKGLFYVLRHLFFTYMFYKFATSIDFFVDISAGSNSFKVILNRRVVRVACWIGYWWWQSITFTGIWCLGHEAGHNTLSPYPFVNAVIGTVLHTFILVPYYAWRSTHRQHHKATNNLERDETHIPFTRKDFKLPNGQIAVKMDYEDILEETPAFSLFKLVVRQLIGWQLYLIHNRKGNPKYLNSGWTSHFNPSSALFKHEERRSIIISNVSIGIMLVIISTYIRYTSWSAAWSYYFVPWFIANNWIVALTYLQHSDPTIPYYRKDQWTFARGALATVDRPFFGWVGNFFLYNISSDHVAHHFFSSVPFYNQPLVTEAIKPILGEYYNYDTTNIFVALWRSFTQCIFVEDEGDIVFYKNQHGESVRTSESKT